jgi:hypothetical protein
VGWRVCRDRIGALGLSGTETDTHTVPPHVDAFSGGTDWGVMGTVTAGYDYQLPQGIVIGAFTDFDFTNAYFTATSPDGDSNRLREHDAFNVGGRIGYLITRNTLLYADGGYTRGNFKFNYSDEYSNGKPLTAGSLVAGPSKRLLAHGAQNSSTVCSIRHRASRKCQASGGSSYSLYRRRLEFNPTRRQLQFGRRAIAADRIRFASKYQPIRKHDPLKPGSRGQLARTKPAL